MNGNATLERKASGSAAASSSFVAGLVSSKTTVNPDVSINLSKPECALRRIKRLRRSVWASGHLHGITDNGHRPPICWFVTLTYAGEDDWKPDHIKTAVNRYRRWCKNAGIQCRYTWVAEIQPKRFERTGKAVVHYHMLCWLPHGVNMPQWDRATKHRDEFWSHGMTNTQKSTAGVGYLMKYLSKLGELTIFPKGLRLYGIGGLTQIARSVSAWYNLPEWVKNQFGVGQVARKKCGFVVHETGEILPAAYKVSFVHGSIFMQKLRELHPRLHDGAYSMLRAV